MATSRSHSSIEKLGVQELVGHLLEIPGTTYEQIVEKVREATGKRVTESALSRYRAVWSNAEAQLRLAKQDAEAITNMMKEHPDTNFTESAMAMLVSKLVRRFAHSAESFENVPLDKLSHLLVKVSRAQQATEGLRIQGERLAMLQQRVAKTAENVEQLGRAKNLDAETLKKIREEIYGLAPAG